MDIQYFDQEHQMHLEGQSLKKPCEKDIVNNAKTRGFTTTDIDIWFDGFQGFWRVSADIQFLKAENNTGS